MEKSRKLTARQKNRLIQRTVLKLKRRIIREVKTGKCSVISKKEYDSWMGKD